MLGLAAIPLLLVIGSALLFATRSTHSVGNWVFVSSVGLSLVVLVIGLPGAVAGNGSQIAFPDPVPVVQVGLNATASGYTLLGLALVAGLIALFSVHDRFAKATLLLGLLGVSIACLGSGIFCLAIGGEIAWFSMLLRARHGSEITHRKWLELLVMQGAIALLFGSAAWYQAAASTTSFDVLPSSAGSVGSFAWALAIVLLVFVCGLSRNNAEDRLFGAVIIVAPMVVVNAVRLGQVSATGLSPGATATLVSGGCLLGIFALVGIYRANTLATAAPWLWVCGFVPLLFVTSVQGAGAFALGAEAVAVLWTGILLSLACTNNELGVTKSLSVVAALGLPFSVSLVGWVCSIAAVAQLSSNNALFWMLIVFSTLAVLVGLRLALRSFEPGLATNRRNRLLLGALATFAVASLVPGIMSASLFTWLVDGATPSGSAFSIQLATGQQWPGGLISGIGLAVFGIVVSALVLLGISPRSLSTAETKQLTSDNDWIRVLSLLTTIYRRVKSFDGWLIFEPRLATLAIVGAVALVVLR